MVLRMVREISDQSPNKRTREFEGGVETSLLVLPTETGEFGLWRSDSLSND
jgi:hypothetical protein